MHSSKFNQLKGLTTAGTILRRRGKVSIRASIKAGAAVPTVLLRKWLPRSAQLVLLTATCAAHIVVWDAATSDSSCRN
jgi:hypothetical protein